MNIIFHEQSPKKQVYPPTKQVYPLWTLTPNSGKALEPPRAAVAGWYHVLTSPELEGAATVGFRTANFSLGDLEPS